MTTPLILLTVLGLFVTAWAVCLRSSHTTTGGTS